MEANMKLALIHLSDIHIRDSKNSIFERKAHFLSSFQNELFDCSFVFIAVSGDIAFSGKESEYTLALDIFQEIANHITKYTGFPPKFIFSPGNHDCNFNTGKTQLRSTLINLLHDKGISIINKEMIDECCATQEDFFNLTSLFEDSGARFVDEKLYKSHIFKLESYSVAFHCYNSSWMSELHEQAGKMSFPYFLFEKQIKSQKSDLSISLVHHPLNWLEPTNSISFRKQLEETSDLILTGHEHSKNISTKTSFNGTSNTYLEGGVFQDNYNESVSEFHFLKFDLNNRQYLVNTYTWNGELYYPLITECEWVPYQRGKALESKHVLSSVFSQFLSDPGAAFQHPWKANLILGDIFVFPDLRIVKKETKTNRTQIPKMINAEKVFTSQNLPGHIILFGDERVGKTSLCKTIFSYFQGNGCVPIFLQGERVRSYHAEEIHQLINKEYANQYSLKSLTEFKQMEKSKKIVIIDDFHLSKLNQRMKDKLLEDLGRYYPNLIVTVNTLYRIENLIPGSTDNDEKEMVNSFTKYEIQRFGHQLRSKLINKWNSIGQVDLVEDNELWKRNDRSKKMIDTIIGNNYVPSFPFFLLTILQTSEMANPHNLKQSSYGHYYDVLIKAALGKINIKNDEIDAYYSYITELAFHFFSKKMSEIDEESLRRFHREFCDEYLISPDFHFLISKLDEVSILEISHGFYRFQYKYVYYYFVARYLANTMTEETSRTIISQMCRKLHVEEFANIIMFLSHMSKDPYIINEILSTSKAIFNRYNIARLESDVTFINELIKEIPDLVLQNKAVKEAREQQLKDQDELEHSDKVEQINFNDYDLDSEESIEDLDLISQLNMSFKAIEILGQLLKNFFGSIKGTKKYELCEEAYNVSLRAINGLFTTLNENIDGIVQEIEQMIESSPKNSQQNEPDNIKSHALRFLSDMCFLISYVFIKKVASSVGSENLTEVFNLIQQNKNNMTSVNLIDMAIKLDQLNMLPVQEIDRLYSNMEGNFLTRAILKKLVIDYIYMFEVNYKVKQQLCAKLGITIKEQLNLEISSTQKKMG
jgi:hypothetical protein